MLYHLYNKFVFILNYAWNRRKDRENATTAHNKVLIVCHLNIVRYLRVSSGAINILLQHLSPKLCLTKYSSLVVSRQNETKKKSAALRLFTHKCYGHAKVTINYVFSIPKSICVLMNKLNWLYVCALRVCTLSLLILFILLFFFLLIFCLSCIYPSNEFCLSEPLKTHKIYEWYVISVHTNRHRRNNKKEAHSGDGSDRSHFIFDFNFVININYVCRRRRHVVIITYRFLSAFCRKINTTENMECFLFDCFSFFGFGSFVIN